MRQAITNIHLLDPKHKRDAGGTLIIENGRVADFVENDQSITADSTIDGEGLHCLPGLVDMQVFTGEPGEEHRETLATASRAAAAGGVTTLVVMPNTQPVIDDAALVDFVTRRARDTAAVNIRPMAAITQGLKGESLTEFGLLREAGAIAFTDGDRSVARAQLMRHALAYAKTFDALIMQHVMDSDLAGNGVMHEGERATRLGLAGIPSAAETIIIDRDLRLVELTGGRWHAAQISCADSVAAIRAAKAKGLSVTCSVSANHLVLNEGDVENYRSFAKLAPPLRSEADRLALVEGVGDGTIDVILSGHNPQDADAKRHPFAQAAFGSVGVETLLATSLTLHHTNGLPLSALIAALTHNPAEILGLECGHLGAGADADFCLVDLGAPWVVDADALTSKSRNAAIEGRHLQGRVRACYVKGEEVFRADTGKTQ